MHRVVELIDLDRLGRVRADKVHDVDVADLRVAEQRLPAALTGQVALRILLKGLLRSDLLDFDYFVGIGDTPAVERPVLVGDGERLVDGEVEADDHRLIPPDKPRPVPVNADAARFDLGRNAVERAFPELAGRDDGRGLIVTDIDVIVIDIHIAWRLGDPDEVILGDVGDGRAGAGESGESGRDCEES